MSLSNLLPMFVFLLQNHWLFSLPSHILSDNICVAHSKMWKRLPQNARVRKPHWVFRARARAHVPLLVWSSISASFDHLPARAHAPHTQGQEVAMVNKIKRFFKGIGKGGYSPPPPPSFGTFPMLADNQMMHERGGSTNGTPVLAFASSYESVMPVLMLPSAAATESSGSGSGVDAVGQRIDTMRWGLLLPRIPRLVAEATAAGAVTGTASSPHSSRTAAAAPSSTGDDNAEMIALLEMLTQMAPKEAQAQILSFYTGDGGASTPTGNSLSSNNSSPAGALGFRRPACGGGGALSLNHKMRGADE